LVWLPMMLSEMPNDTRYGTGRKSTATAGTRRKSLLIAKDSGLADGRMSPVWDWRRMSPVWD
jgi:hypothetical protein